MLPYIFVFPILWLGGWIIASVIYRRRNDKPIIPRKPSDAVFYENWCSGRSLRNCLTRFGGASNCLMVYVRGNEFVVTPMFPFTLMFLPEIYSLEIRVPLSAITSVETKRFLLRQTLQISFAQDMTSPIELRLHDESGLLRCLGQNVPIQGDRIPSPSPKKPRRSYRLIYLRVFAFIWGFGVLFAAKVGLPDDYRYRRDGIEITGVFDGHSGVTGDRNDMGILSYSVGDQRYHLTSLRGNGIYKIGDTERLFYLSATPDQAREADYLIFDLIALFLGLLAITLSIFGSKIARKLS